MADTEIVWVVSGECGLNEHWVERVLRHEPTPEELEALDDAVHGPETPINPNPFKSYPTGWNGWRVARMVVGP